MPGEDVESARMGTAREPGPEDDLPNVGAPARRAFAEAGLVRLEQFAGVAENDLLALHGVGPKAIGILRRALAERGLSFGEPTPRG